MQNLEKTSEKVEEFVREDILFRQKGFVGEHAVWLKSIARVIFGLMWFADALLKLSPPFSQNFLVLVQSQAAGQIGLIGLYYKFWNYIVTPIPLFWVFVITFTEFSLSISLIFGFMRKIGYIAGIITSLVIWSVPEHFGGPYSEFSTNIGTGIVYAMVFLLFIVINSLQGPSRYSIDYYIEKRFRWWRFLAEFS